MIGISPFIMDHTKEEYRNELFSLNNALHTFAFAGGSFLTFISGFLGVRDPIALYRESCGLVFCVLPWAW